MRGTVRDDEGAPSAATLTAAQAAARLGIRTESLYAYVSRGLLARQRTARGSLFDPLEIERFALARRRPSAAPNGAAPTAGSDGRPLGVIDTDIALIEDGRLWLRGRDAASLARDHTYDQVATWLLTRDDAALSTHESLTSTPEAARAAAAAVTALPPASPSGSRLLAAVAALGALDPVRFDLAPDAVAGTARRLIAGVVDALPVLGEPVSAQQKIAARLWPRLTALAPSPARLHVLDLALVLLVDHDMAASTLAARAAASARAHPYAVVAAGLGAADSAAHGAASAAAHGMIADAVRIGPERAVAEWSRRTPFGMPGFGQPLYPDGDPRAHTLLAAVRAIEPAAAAVAAADGIVRLVETRTGAHPNVDLALGATTVAFDMADDAGETVFAIARMTGWNCHAVAEYALPPLRLRPVGRYVGPPPIEGEHRHPSDPAG